MRTNAIISTSSSTASSSAMPIYEMPAVYTVIAILLMLFIFYLLCRIKRKDRYSMKKSSYIKLFFAIFAPLLLYNLYNMYNSIRFAASLISLDFRPFILKIILTIALSLMESIFPYLFITLCILIINCYRKSAQTVS